VLKATKTEELIRPVGVIQRGRAEWLSLVRHGANRTPFIAVKHDGADTGGGMGIQAVQSILMPEDVDLGELRRWFDEVGMSNVNLAGTVKSDGIVEYVQEDAAKFDGGADSLDEIALGDTGVRLRVGYLSVESAAKADLASILTVPEGISMSTPISAEVEVRTETFRSAWYDKSEALFYAVCSAVELQADPVTRKQQVMNAVTAFSEWVASAMDTLNAVEQAMGTQTNSNGGGADGAAQKSDTSKSPVSTWWGSFRRMITGDVAGDITNSTTNDVAAIAAAKSDDTNDTGVVDMNADEVRAIVTEALKADREAQAAVAASAQAQAEAAAKVAELEALKSEVAELRAWKDQAAAKSDADATGEAQADAQRAEELQAIKSDLGTITAKLAAWEASPGTVRTQDSGRAAPAVKSDDPDAVFLPLFNEG
jgi:hypothetical protein